MRVLCLLAFSRLISDSISGFAKNRFMPKLPRVTLLKQVKVNDTWRHARALFDSKGRVRRDHVRFNGKDETHPEGSYFIEWWDEGKRHCEPAGADAQDAADKARVKQAELTAQRNGILPPATNRRSSPGAHFPACCARQLSGICSLSPIPANLPHLPAHSRIVQRVLPQDLC